MSLLVAWTSTEAVRYAIEERGRTFCLTAEGNVVRPFSDTIEDAGRAEWLALSDLGRTARTRSFFANARPPRDRPAAGAHAPRWLVSGGRAQGSACHARGGRRDLDCRRDVPLIRWTRRANALLRICRLHKPDFR